MIISNVLMISVFVISFVFRQSLSRVYQKEDTQIDRVLMYLKQKPQEFYEVPAADFHSILFSAFLTSTNIL